MNDIDILLSMVENPTRRKILEALVREPHYPLQLSKELGVSQQAVMKNLNLMEQNGMVVSHRVDSNMGPQRTLYVPSKEFTLVIDLHNCMFTTRLLSNDIQEPEEVGLVDAEEAIERIRELDSQIDELEKQRKKLLDERNSIVAWFTERIQESDDYEERKALYDRLDELTGMHP